MRTRYQRWMFDWETRLTMRDTNRVVRSLDWGLEWTKAWPVSINGAVNPVAEPERYLSTLSRAIVAESDRFYSYTRPTDFRLEQRIPPAKPGQTPEPKPATFLRFTSPVQTPYPENNLVNARWFPARGRRAVVVFPQWNSDAESHNALCRIFNFLGIAALRLSMPYHDVRMPPELERADYAVSSNIGRTIDSTRQAVVDARCCLDWLESQGYTELGLMGTSLGSCYAFITAAHDHRVKVCAYNHASTYFGDVVWTGQSTRHIRAGIEGELTQDRLRELWLGISPMSYFDHYQRHSKKSLVIYATYDLTFLPEFSRLIVEEFKRRSENFRVCILPCGHYTTGETPYKYLCAFHLARFLSSAF